MNIFFAVIRVKVKKQRKEEILGKKPRIYKKNSSIQSRSLKRPKLVMKSEASCCKMKFSTKPYLIMGSSQGNNLLPTFILPWKKFKVRNIFFIY